MRYRHSTRRLQPFFERGNLLTLFSMATLSQKLKLKENTEAVTIYAPKDLSKTLAPLPKGVSFSDMVKKNHDFIMLFVKDKAELEKHIFKACNALAKDGLIWICYPKGSSGIQTDLTRDKGWESLEGLNMQWISLISLDDTWSAFCMRNTPPKETNKISDEYHSNKTEWADAATKTVRIPEDLEIAMAKGKVRTFFDEQNFTNRKEYVLWIISARQEKTRKERIEKAVEKMKAGLKNPTMK